MRDITDVGRDVTAVVPGEAEWVDTTSIGASPTYTAISLCSGCGGLDLGFVTAGYEVRLTIECDPHAVATYRTNFPSATLIDRPVQTVPDADMLVPLAGRTPDLLCCGLPCQAYARCGRKDPLDDNAWLFPQLVRVAKLIRPHVIVVENVMTLRTVHGGVFLRWIIGSLVDIGYHSISWAVLNAADYGVPQARRRLIIVANRWGLPNPYPLPILAEPFHRSVDSTIADLAGLPQDVELDHVWPGAGPGVEARMAGLRSGEPLYPTYKTACCRLPGGRPSLTIMADQPHIHPHLSRFLSVREMARLQGFPDWFRFEGPIRARQRQVGNAVPPPLAEHVALALRVLLDEVA